MNSLLELEAVTTTVVRNLRRIKLKSGKTFMIHSNKLPENQSYLEYPDETIKIVSAELNAQSFKIITQLTPYQANQVRKDNNLV